MKILFIGQFAPPVHGVTQMNEYALKAFQPNNIVKTVNLSFSSDIRSIKKFDFGKLKKTIHALFSTLKSLKLFSPDLIYYTLCPTGIAFFRDVAFVFILKLFKSKIVFHLHGQGIKEKSKQSLIYRLAYRFVFKNAYAIHLSETFIDEISGYIKGDRIFILNNCVLLEDEKKYTNPDKDDETSFLFLSNLMIKKGFAIYLHALSILHSKGYKFKATLAGNFPDIESRNSYDNWEKANQALIKSGNFSYSPGVYKEEKFRLLSKHDIFVFPSMIDTYPVVLIEAQAMSMACISTKVGAIQEMLDHEQCGISVNPGSIDELADAMIYMIENRNHMKLMQSSSKDHFQSTYTYATFSKNINKIIDQIGGAS